MLSFASHCFLLSRAFIPAKLNIFLSKKVYIIVSIKEHVT